MGKKIVIFTGGKRDLSGIKDKLSSKIPDSEITITENDPKAATGADCVFISIENPVFDSLQEKVRIINPHGCVFALIFSDTPYKIASKAIASDTYKYMEYPDDFEKITDILRAFSAVAEKGDNSGIVGSGESKKAIMDFIGKASLVALSVLIEGESGTGKELVANAVHNKSSRSGNAFIAVNCAAFPKELVENELFGHEPGAFSGATGVKKGLFEIADKGTLFIDEIGEMDLSTQAKLLRVLETGKFRRLGGVKELFADVRIIGATNKILENEIQSGKFRLDLFYRLCVLRLFIPPLRDRWGDIPEIVEHFLKLGKYHKQFEPAALELFQDYSWPGNVRELKNAVDRSAAFCGGTVISIKDLPDHIRNHEKKGTVLEPVKDESLESFVNNMEKELLTRAMSKFGNKKTEVANALKISRFTLYRKLEKYGIS